MLDDHNGCYPMLVGNRLRLHTMVAFIGSVGGIVLFGASGLVLGPVVIAITISLLDVLKNRLTDQLEAAPTRLTELPHQSASYQQPWVLAVTYPSTSEACWLAPHSPRASHLLDQAGSQCGGGIRGATRCPYSTWRAFFCGYPA
ncbi:AI-2E family transporter [Mesorhizobium sp. M0019]|uniref:AI-2E family transporter n=1 Tax=Mesorhizobium sp. M0019 TaxID=2956845 RepID=UPI003336A01D